MEKDRRPRSEHTQPLMADITHASLGRSIEFVFPSADAAKTGALKAMRAIHLDDGILSDIRGVDLSTGKGQVGWDYYYDDHGMYALKTGLNFKELKDGRWVLDIDKKHSEETSFREEVEKAVGEPSVVSGASISLKLPSPEQGGRYLDTIGLDLTPKHLSGLAQDEAYASMTNFIRDITAEYDFNTNRYTLDRPEDMGQVLIDTAQHSSRDVQERILGAVDKRLSETDTRGGSALQVVYPGGSLNAALENNDFDPIDLMRKIFEDMGKAARLSGYGGLSPASYAHFYSESLQKAYEALEGDDKVKLYEALYRKCKARVEEKGGSMPTQLRFNKENLFSHEFTEEYTLSAESVAPITSEYLTARASTEVEGTFDLVGRTFNLDEFPTDFKLRVDPTPEYRYANDKNVQALINVTASSLALQEPTYLTTMMHSARADNSHFWAINKFGTTLMATDNPHLQRMGLDVFSKSRPESLNPEMN